MKPVALAGVMGGLDTEISDASRNVMVESAVFRPETIRKTARRLALASEASYRFERGVDQLLGPHFLPAQRRRLPAAQAGVRASMTA